MLALQIEDVKQFMLQLFSKDTFDAFWLYEAKIKMSVSYVVDGMPFVIMALMDMSVV